MALEWNPRIAEKKKRQKTLERRTLFEAFAKKGKHGENLSFGNTF